MMQELLKRTMESASKYASSVLEKLSNAHESAQATEALARAQALVTVSTRGAEELSAEQAFVGKSLDELIAWFKSYGVDQPLILQPKDHQRSDYSQELNSKAA
jgi:ParB-like chromosome segregation protein Spo0J